VYLLLKVIAFLTAVLAELSAFSLLLPNFQVVDLALQSGDLNFFLFDQIHGFPLSFSHPFSFLLSKF